jgi:hypothetical protein
MEVVNVRRQFTEQGSLKTTFSEFSFQFSGTFKQEGVSNAKSKG